MTYSILSSVFVFNSVSELWGAGGGGGRQMHFENISLKIIAGTVQSWALPELDAGGMKN